MPVVPKVSTIADSANPLKIQPSDWNALLNNRLGVNARDYGADPTGVADSSAAIQAAIDTGKTVILPEGTYRAVALSLNTAGQCLLGAGSGLTILQRATNGTLITLTKASQQLRGLSVRGESSTPAFTGDNIVINGTNPDDVVLHDVDSRWTLGRPLYAPCVLSGLRVEGGSYSHEGASGNPCMEIGYLAAPSTINYATIVGVVTHESDQPIKFIAVAGASIVGCQIGGFVNLNGTTQASTVNKMLGCRVIGDMQILGASHVFIGNAVAPGKTVTFDVDGLSTANGCLWIGVEGNTATVVNNGNANNLILRAAPTGTGGLVLGGTTSLAQVGYDVSTGDLTLPSNVIIPNAKAFKGKMAGGTALNIGFYNASDNCFFGPQSVSGMFTDVNGATSLTGSIGGTTKWATGSDYFRPQTDNTINLGGGSNRWKEIFAGNGTINTSDAREKQEIAPIDDTVLDAWATIDYQQYRWCRAVEEKGDAARVHHGIVAQRISEAFAARGLDAHRYGLFIHDTWPAHEIFDGFETVTLPDGSPDRRERTRTVPAGDRYGVRYDQCLVLEAALMRRTTARLEARVAALETPSGGTP